MSATIIILPCVRRVDFGAADEGRADKPDTSAKDKIARKHKLAKAKRGNVVSFAPREKPSCANSGGDEPDDAA